MKAVKYLLFLSTLLLLFFLFVAPSAKAEEDKPDMLAGENTLSPPTFTLSPLSFTYDTKPHILKVENLFHEFEKEGFYTYSWYKNGVLLGGSADNITVDDTTLFWTAEANCNHGEIIVDLEEIHDISFICIIERLDCSRINNYSLYISEDGLEWHPIVEKKLGLWYGQPQVFEFAPRNTRYIKISIHDTIAGNDGCREPGLARVMAFKQPANM